MAGKKPYDEDHKILKEQFERWDKDKSGSIDEAELTKVLHALYSKGIKKDDPSLAEGDAKKMLAMMDLDNDGKVSWAEFEKAVGS